jgi:hypothetical protein
LLNIFGLTARLLEESLRPLSLDASARKRFFKALWFYSGFSRRRAKTALIISLR